MNKPDPLIHHAEYANDEDYRQNAEKISDYLKGPIDQQQRAALLRSANRTRHINAKILDVLTAGNKQITHIKWLLVLIGWLLAIVAWRVH